MKKLMRNSFKGKIGGVCEGIGEYLGIDPTILRIISVIGLVTTFGFVLLSYLILWALLPDNQNV